MQKFTIRVRSSDLALAKNSLTWARNLNGDVSFESNVMSFGGGGVYRFAKGSTICNSYLSEIIPERISAISISGCGNLLASIGSAGFVVWDLVTDKIKYHGPSGLHVSCLCFSHDSKLLCSVGNQLDRRMVIFSTDTGNIITSAPLPPSACIVSVTGGGHEKDAKRRQTDKYIFGTCGGDGIILWVFDPRCVSVTPKSVPTRLVRDSVASTFSQSGDAYFVATSSGEVLSVDVKSQCVSGQLQVAGSGGITSLAREDRFVFAGCKDGSVYMLGETDDGPDFLQPLKKIQIDKSSFVTSLSVRSSSPQLLVGMSSGSIYEVDVRSTSMSPVELVHLPTHPINQLIQVTDSSFVSASNELVQWDKDASKILYRCPKEQAISCFCWSGPLALLGRSDDRVIGVDNKVGGAVWEIAVPCPSGVKLTRNLKNAVVATSEGEVRLYDLRNREMKLRFKQHMGKTSCLDLFADETFAISSGRDGAIITYDLVVGKEVSSLRAPRRCGINSFILCRDQASVFSAGMDKRITQWDLRVADPIAFFSTGTEVVSMASCEASNGTNLFLTGDTEGIVRLLDSSMNELDTMPYRHCGKVQAVSVAAINGNALTVISGGDDNSIFEYCLRQSFEVEAKSIPHIGKLELT